MKEIEKVGREYFQCNQCVTTKTTSKYRWNTPITKNTYYICGDCCKREFRKIKHLIDEKYKEVKC